MQQPSQQRRSAPPISVHRVSSSRHGRGHTAPLPAVRRCPAPARGLHDRGWRGRAPSKPAPRRATDLSVTERDSEPVRQERPDRARTYRGRPVGGSPQQRAHGMGSARHAESARQRPWMPNARPRRCPVARLSRRLLSLARRMLLSGRQGQRQRAPIADRGWAPMFWTIRAAKPEPNLSPASRAIMPGKLIRVAIAGSLAAFRTPRRVICG